MKKVLVSSALSALLVLPAAALEVYSGDNATLSVYGAIKGYVGMGENAHISGPANFLFGVQGNSNIGFDVVADKFKAKVEFGAIENDVMGTADGVVAPIRYLWGSYDTGLGTILIGKANTPTTDIFSTGVINNDTALNGFGGLSTATRRLQAQYNVASLSLALISDYIAENLSGDTEKNNRSNTTMPRIALSYTIYNGSNPLFQIAGTYKHFNKWSDGIYKSTNSDDDPEPGNPKDAWHISVGTKPTFGNNFVSLFGFYGKNQDLYGETGTFYNGGGWTHAIHNISGATEEDIKRAGGKAELGIGLSKDATFTIGAGYQETKKSQAKQGPLKCKSIGVFAQVPYKVSANFTLTPVVGWFQTEADNRITSVVAAGRVMWSF